jgi:hypothetical protein
VRFAHSASFGASTTIRRPRISLLGLKSPLSPYDDYKFYMPFDNIQGFVTAISLVNPATNFTGHVTITALDLEGNFIDQTIVTMLPGTHTAFILADRLALANRLGTLYVKSDITRLAALGLRFNNLGGFAFSSIPIMNWSGMFP